MPPPRSLVGHLRIGLGLFALYHKNYGVAHEHFAAAAIDEKVSQEVAAEGLYWLGVAEYRLRGLVGA